MQFQDLAGQRFGRLLITSFAEFRQEDARCRRAHWHCQCDCGNQAIASGKAMKSGNTLSCGCLRKETTVAKNYRHGQAKRGDQSPEYKAWCEIIRRTENPNCAGYANYGGRGIRMTEPWRSDYASFLADMRPRPSPRHSIDRIDNAGNYERLNCQWATKIVQNRNRRSNVMLTHDGLTLCIAEWAERIGINPTTLYCRIHRSNWTVEKSLTTPVFK